MAGSGGLLAATVMSGGGAGTLESRILNLENNESIYGLFEYTGLNISGQITIPAEAIIYDWYGDGIIDAFMVEADGNNNPTDTPSVNSTGQIIQVNSLDAAGNYVLSDTPDANACIMYYVRIKDKFAQNIPLTSIFEPARPISQSPYGMITVARSNADFTSIKEACDYVATRSSAGNPYAISAVGAFVESPFTIPAYTKLLMDAASVTAADNLNPIITMQAYSEIVGGNIVGPSGSDAVRVLGGNTAITRCVISGYGQVGINALNTGPDRLVVRNVTLSGGQVGVKCDNSFVIVTTSSAVGCSDVALWALNGSNSVVDSFLAAICAKDLRISDTSTMSMNSSQVDIDKIEVSNYDNVQLAFQSSKEGDESAENIQEVHIGVPERGYEFSAGEGESYTRGMLVYTETPLNVFADVSDSAASASGSLFTYPGVTANNSLYITSALSNETDVLYHYGIKALVDTAADYGSGIIVLEYWNGSEWEEANGSDRNGNVPYLNRAKKYFTSSGPLQLRYDINMPSSWVKNDPMGLGTSYYWARFRILSDITVAPVFQQFKLHPSKFEFNADAFREFFGPARSIGQLPLNIGQGKPIAGNMQNQTLWIDENVGVGLQTNKFTATGDILGWNFLLPFDADTSSLISFIWGGLPSQAAVIQWTVRVSHIESGVDSLYSVNPAAGSNPYTKSVVVNGGITVTGVPNTYSADLDLSDAVERRSNKAGDLIFITLQPTILSGTFSLVGAGASYTKWSDGGHI